MSSPDRATLERIAAWLADAPRVLIGAGAGLSVAAGIDYSDTASFARLYPGMARRGFSACYERIGRHDLPPEVSGGTGRFTSTMPASANARRPSTRRSER